MCVYLLVQLVKSQKFIYVCLRDDMMIKINLYSRTTSETNIQASERMRTRTKNVFACSTNIFSNLYYISRGSRIKQMFFKSVHNFSHCVYKHLISRSYLFCIEYTCDGHETNAQVSVHTTQSRIYIHKTVEVSSVKP